MNSCESDSDIRVKKIIKSLKADTFQTRLQSACLQEILQSSNNNEIMEAIERWLPDIYKQYHLLLNELLIKSFNCGYDMGKRNKESQIRSILGINTD